MKSDILDINTLMGSATYEEVQASNDSPRLRPSSVRLQRRSHNVSNSEGPAPGSGDDIQAPAEEAEDSPASNTVEEILIERRKTHGDFGENAKISQALKRIFHSEVGWDRLSDVQRESIHMVCLKLSRIITGQQNEKDHWDDIAGYAKLASERIER